MTTSNEMLQSADDCSALLTSILADGKPKRGLTLIALVDHATLRLHGIARMPIPHSDRTHPRRGLLHRGVGARVGHGPARVGLAQWSGRQLALAGREAPRHELVTVVCREGDLDVGDTEKQFHFGCATATTSEPPFKARPSR